MTATATPTFRRAIQVHLSDTGCYEFSGARDFAWSEVLRYAEGFEVFEPLKGWGDYTHSVLVDFGPRKVYYFVR